MGINAKTYNPNSESNLFQFLDTNGNGTGTTNARGNYSNKHTQFYIQPNANEEYLIKRLIVSISDVGAVDAGSYGNGVVLKNGIILQKQDVNGNVLIDLTQNQPIKTNGEWGKFCYGIVSTSFGSGLNYVNVRWSFNKTGDGIFLNDNEKLVITLNDRFVGLRGHYFLAQGIKL